jgi:type I restriction-modification system DNA methylase subunit
MKKQTTHLRTADQKEFVKKFNALCGAHSRWEVWSDFVQMSAIAISNAVDKANAPERVKAFQTMASKYSDQERNALAELLAELVAGMEANPDRDYLGELYMVLELGNQKAGQFFTPYDVCRAMAALTWGDQEERIRKQGWISVNDCACGAGATLLAFANECRRHGINYQTSVLFVAQDVDAIVAAMCYLQLSLMGCAGYVVVGNTLSNPKQAVDKRGLIPVHGPDVWYTPMYFRQEWHMRRVWALMENLFQPKKEEKHQ